MPVTTPVEGQTAIQDFIIDTPVAIPKDVRQNLRELSRPGVSPVDAIVNCGELIYANRDNLPPELLQLGAELINCAMIFNFHGLADSGRGAGIVATLLAVPKVALPVEAAPAEAPEALERFAPPAEPVEPPAS